MNVLSAGSEDSCICDFNWRIIAESLTELSRRQHCRISAACDSGRMTGKPEVMPGQKSASGKSPADNR